MTNITGVPAFGGGGVAFRQPPDPPQPAVPAISQTSLNGAETYTKGDELPGQSGLPLSYKFSAETEGESDTPTTPNDAGFDAGAKPPEDVLTGPTPAFQASVLEVELDLRNALAEIAAKRTRAADEAAIEPAAPQHGDPLKPSKTMEMALRPRADHQLAPPIEDVGGTPETVAPEDQTPMNE